MRQNLMEQLHEHSKQYDPFGNPPDFELAQIHRQATMVGVVKRKERPQFCPCCDNIVNKQPLPVNFKDEDLLIFGVGYPLYYKIAKYFMLILLGIFFISGSAMYFLMTLQCDAQSQCLSLFGIPVINISIMEENNLDKTQLVNTLTALGIFISVLYLKTIINDDVRVLTAKKNCPSMYTVMLQNVPAVSDKELSQWLTERFDTAPVEINWAYDVRQLSKAIKKKQDSVIELNKVKISIAKLQSLNLEFPDNSAISRIKKGEKTEKDLKFKAQKFQADIKLQDLIMEKYNANKAEFEKVGTVFVTFEKVSTVNKIIANYECSFFNSVFKALFSYIKRSKLFFKKQVIMVNKAPAPRQIIWQNLAFSYIRSIFFELVFILVMVMMLMGALRVILWFMNYALSFRIQGFSSGQVLIIIKGIFMSLLVVIINCLMRLVIQFFTYAKKYNSYTKYEGSFTLYYSIFYVINSCCVVYLVHENNLQDTKQLLLTDIHLIMLANAFSQPLFKLFDPVMWFHIAKRYWISKMKPEKNPYTQQYVNKLWEGHEISNPDNYQYITRVLFITTWFATVAPMGVLITLVALVIDYWISKWMLVRYYKIPENISEDIAKPTLNALELLPLVYILGILQFNYKVSTSQTLFDFFFNFLHYGITTLILLLSLCGYFIFCSKKIQPEVKRGYSRAKVGFRYNYEMENPLTKLKGDINYLTEVLKNSKDFEDNQQISKLIRMSTQSPEQMGIHRQDLFRLKMEMQERLSKVQEVDERSEDVEMQHINAQKNVGSHQD